MRAIAWRDYLTLWALSQKRIRSQVDYRRFQSFQASLILKYLSSKGVNIQGKVVLDLGSGIGGYSEEMARRGAEVLSVDLMSSTVMLTEGCTPIIANALAIPLDCATVDFVFCASLIEHLSDPQQLLIEIARVLRPGGYCYLSFPPYYSPTGGHAYAPFHYFGEEWAMRLAHRRNQRRHVQWVRDLYHVVENPTSFAETYIDWGLYVMTVRRARQIIAVSMLQLLEMSTRYLPFSFIRWPLIGEVLTWHAQFLLYKPDTSDFGVKLFTNS